MTLLIALLWALVYVVIFAIVVYLVIWVLEIVGVSLPAKVVQLLWVLVALIAVIVVVMALAGNIPPLRVGALAGGTVAAIPAGAAANLRSVLT